MRRILRYMQNSDIQQVVAIDHASFDPPWSEANYDFEINRSPCSFMVVLEERKPIKEPSMWQMVSARLQGQADPESSTIVGYGGLWKIQEESHISTIASHPNARRLGYGEIVLAGMVLRAVALGAEYMVLEVRVSNVGAQTLYHKYGFKIVDTKHNYYRNNNEDAYDMRLDLTNESQIAYIQTLYHAIQARTPFEDIYSQTMNTRLKL